MYTNYFNSTIGVVSALLLLCSMGAFYFMPATIARKKKNSGTIFLCNLFFGATGVGWFICLIWALNSEYDYDFEEENSYEEE